VTEAKPEVDRETVFHRDPTTNPVTPENSRIKGAHGIPITIAGKAWYFATYGVFLKPRFVKTVDEFDQVKKSCVVEQTISIWSDVRASVQKVMEAMDANDGNCPWDIAFELAWTSLNRCHALNEDETSAILSIDSAEFNAILPQIVVAAIGGYSMDQIKSRPE
jgi:hypothetical protein